MTEPAPALAAGPDQAIERVIAMAHEIDRRECGTALHSQVVARYAELAARELRLPEDVVEDVRLAGLLHDVGKSAVPDAIVSKPAALDEAEWTAMSHHPRLGAALLDDAGLDEVREWILCHHERPDGKGYPRGLRGDDIPELARIISVADTYDVMTARDSYRAPVSSYDAIQELRRVAGEQLDERFVEIFIELLEGKDVSFQHGEAADFERELALEARVEEVADPLAGAGRFGVPRVTVG